MFPKYKIKFMTSLITVKNQPPFSPKTELAKKLWEIRQKVVNSGVSLLTWDDIELELQERRGLNRKV